MTTGFWWYEIGKRRRNRNLSSLLTMTLTMDELLEQQNEAVNELNILIRNYGKDNKDTKAHKEYYKK